MGIDVGLMRQYIEFVADETLSSLEFPKKYGVTNPFDFMDGFAPRYRNQDLGRHGAIIKHAKMDIGLL